MINQFNPVLNILNIGKVVHDILSPIGKTAVLHNSVSIKASGSQAIGQKVFELFVYTLTSTSSKSAQFHPFMHSFRDIRGAPCDHGNDFLSPCRIE